MAVTENASMPGMPAPPPARRVPLGLSGRLAHLRQFIELAEQVAEVVADGELPDVLHLACRGFVDLLELQRCTVHSEEPDRSLRCRGGDVPGGGDLRRPDLPYVEALTARLDAARGQRRHGVFRFHPADLPCPDGERRAVTVLVVPVGDRAFIGLEGPPGWQCTEEERALVRVTAGLLGERTRAARRLREEEQHSTTAHALRQLLEMGVQAGSAIEAARALASTAARVLGCPVGCAYLVDDAGRITDMVTVGADAERAEQLRRQLVGRRAADSPVWQRTVVGPDPGPDLIEDTRRSGIVRTRGVAQLLGLRCLAAIPLLSSDGPLGLVLCGDHVPRRQWRAGDRELLARLSLEGAVVVDNARLRQAERHEATHDALTGLLNRRAYASTLRRALACAKEGGEEVALLLLDLDRFKEVNDQLGHHRGDELLVAVSERLRSCLGPGEHLARLGGDEFAVLVERDGTRGRAEAIATELALSLAEPFEISEMLLHVDVSIGIACFPSHGGDADTLLQRSDAAMYEAKRAGVDHVVYGPAVAARTAAEVGLLGELRRALQDDGAELVLHYQPKVALSSGEVTGVEALVRWRHPRHGLLAPGRFVPMAEESGLVRALTAWVVPHALAQAARWRSTGLELPVAVNVSARDLADRRFPEKVGAWLEAAGLPGASLVVEVTEGTVMGEPVEASAALERLRALGVRVSLDDFGTGYSSLAYLETLPIDELKVDRQFLHLGRSRGSVMRSIVSLGHDLDLTVVAEGVEGADQARWLAEVGCDEAQGYHFAVPMAPADLEAWRFATAAAGAR